MRWRKILKRFLPIMFFDKTACLLSSLGRGTFHFHTGDWEPPQNGVYSFDMEGYNIEKMVTHFLLGVSAIGGDELVFTGIQEDTDGVDWEEGAGTRTVRFDWKGKTYPLAAKAMTDWFDPAVANKLNQIILAEGTGK